MSDYRITRDAVITGTGGTPAELVLDNGTNTLTIRAPASMPESYSFKPQSTQAGFGNVFRRNILKGTGIVDSWAPQRWNPLTWVATEEQPPGTDSQVTAVNNTWVQREINTLAPSNDDVEYVSMSANSLTLLPGVYYIEAVATAASADNHQLRLNNVTTAAIEHGPMSRSIDTSLGSVMSGIALIRALITITDVDGETIIFEHWVNTSGTLQPLGVDSTGGTTGRNVYFEAKLLKAS